MFITKKRHEALIAKAEAQRDKETLRANGLAAEARALLIQNETHVELGRSAERKLKLAIDEREAASAKLNAMVATLADIAGQETPTANATVKRMARMARDGIGSRNARKQVVA